MRAGILDQHDGKQGVQACRARAREAGPERDEIERDMRLEFIQRKVCVIVPITFHALTDHAASSNRRAQLKTLDEKNEMKKMEVRSLACLTIRPHGT